MDQTDLETRETTSLHENDPLKAYPAGEVSLVMSNNNLITVFEGLPELTEQNTAIVPNKPHIFRADKITVCQEKNGQPERLEIEDKVVLVMHGELRRDDLYPKSSHDNPSGVQYYSIVEIIKAYERTRERDIDILVVCSGKTTTPQDLDPIPIFQHSFTKTGKTPFTALADKIHTVCEQAATTISKNPDDGRVSLYLTTPSRDFLFIPNKHKKPQE